MTTKAKNVEKARFDTRLTKEQKLIFERAAILGGYRNLTDFVLSAVQEKAKKIMMENEKILSSMQDREIFFNSITNPDAPNSELLTALQQYEKKISE